METILIIVSYQRQNKLDATKIESVVEAKIINGDPEEEKMWKEIFTNYDKEASKNGADIQHTIYRFLSKYGWVMKTPQYWFHEPVLRSAHNVTKPPSNMPTEPPC